ncbi:hypothetical protein DL96DRAFT_1734301, partial [Flagelloscypha sp. PMI_526]
GSHNFTTVCLSSAFQDSYFILYIRTHLYIPLPTLSSKMALLSIFPEDILGLFCLHLPNPALKQCCLTSQSFRYFSRPLLFERITIQNSTDELGPSDDDLKFWEALRVDSDIGSLVKSLELHHADLNSTHHWLKSFQIEPKLAYIMTHLPNLTSFSITRYSPPPGISERYWVRTGWLEFTSVIQHILNLATLKNFHFSERYDFQSPHAFRQLFCLTRPSTIRSFHLYGGRLFEEDKPSSSSVPAIYQAQVTNLRLYYIDETPSVGLRLILSLISPASSLNVTNLSSLELSAIGVQDETWIPTILNAQKSDSALQHLGPFAVEEYPKNELFIQSLSRFTSIYKLSISEANSPIFTYQTLEVGGIKFGFAAAWMSALPKKYHIHC